ncbi:hypothetical protein HK097_008767 [Rhizophlyctis rosea]|uniref:RGS domain-containing protein n=1 Tax=Rhizophlyctis rosea TaxID=64517 RepID=A0AAD5X0W7_9FUNG|nr:hypothetical protein HK097_008767 [Rhizophlyctis rosea]
MGEVAFAFWMEEVFTKPFSVQGQHDADEDSETFVFMPSFTRECFFSVMTHPPLFEEFKKFANSLHSSDNINFWESVLELENLLCEDIPWYGASRDSSYALSRFVNRPEKGAPGTSSPVRPPVPLPLPPSESDGQAPLPTTIPPPIPAHQTPSIPIPPHLQGHFLYFHACYIAPNAPQEMNLSSRIRHDIARKIRTGQLNSTLFDAAIDEVLQMIYFNTFKKFIAAKEAETVENPTSEPYKPSPTRRASVFKHRTDNVPVVIPSSESSEYTMGPNATSASAMAALAQNRRREKRYSKSLDLSNAAWLHNSSSSSVAGDSLSSLASRSRVPKSKSATNIASPAVWTHEMDAPPLPSSAPRTMKFPRFMGGGSGRYRHGEERCDDGQSDSGVSFMSTRSKFSVASAKFSRGLKGMKDKVRGR